MRWDMMTVCVPTTDALHSYPEVRVLLMSEWEPFAVHLEHDSRGTEMVVVSFKKKIEYDEEDE